MEKNNHLKIKAGIFLFPTKLGGKSWNIRNNYHPSLIWGFEQSLEKVIYNGTFFLKDHTQFKAKKIDGIFLLQEEGILGKYFICTIKIYPEEWLFNFLEKGTHFYISEGRKIVGFGVFLEKHND